MYIACFWSRSCTNARTLMPRVGEGDFLIMNNTIFSLILYTVNTLILAESLKIFFVLFFLVGKC